MRHGLGLTLGECIDLGGEISMVCSMVSIARCGGSSRDPGRRRTNLGALRPELVVDPAADAPPYSFFPLGDARLETATSHTVSVCADEPTSPTTICPVAVVALTIIRP
jgi:hypothetical protein